ncbi:MCE family protein [Mycobacterium sp. DL440]|uniref:MCE family protein n=1 Tax=Mycobacterium sp. DL440 TaxID=2675523 RepID=UPI001422AC36|nr:MCE family protein [Mycobacterium sp. DL440]
MSPTVRTLLKFGSFALVMAILTTLLFMTFAEYRSGPTTGYSAIFADASRLKSGDSVRAAGVRIGTVRSVTLRADDRVLVTFDTDRNIALTSGATAAIRYLNLVGDRYLELVDRPDSTRILPAGAQLPVDRTMPALDLDLLLGGLKPVIAGLNPQDVNALTTSLLQVFQGQGDTLQSLMSRGSSFANTLADNSQVIQQVIDNLNTMAGTLAQDGDHFSRTLDRLEVLVTDLAQHRDTIGSAVDALSSGTTTLADLLTNTRAPLAGTVEQLETVSSHVVGDMPTLDVALQRAPDNYRKLVRLGSYGAWLNYYICGISLRVTDLQGRTAVFPWVKQDVGRCADS